MSISSITNKDILQSGNVKYASKAESSNGFNTAIQKFQEHEIEQERIGALNIGALNTSSVKSANSLVSINQTNSDISAFILDGEFKAREILKKLKKLHIAFLSGRVTHAELQELALFVQESIVPSENSELSKILEEISLRAEVELAKFEIYTN
ncbi:MAG: flagellar assembly protein FliX [Rickettsiaceae bacterium]|nr:flagellar assembly protein FliX [Rickettsiaceae bacterium]